MTNPDCRHCEKREMVWAGVPKKRRSLNRGLKKGKSGLAEGKGNALQARGVGRLRCVQEIVCF